MKLRKLNSTYCILFLVITLIYLKFQLSFRDDRISSTPTSTTIRNEIEKECQRPCEAIVTLVTGDAYLLGALVLGYTLKKYGAATHRDIIAIIPEGTMENTHALAMLKQVGWTILNVRQIKYPGNVTLRFQHSLVKLYAWNMTQYKIIGALDADAVLLGSIEEPFQYMRQHRNTRLLAANDPYMVSVVNAKIPKYKHFNSGVLFLRPNAKDYLQLVQYSTDESYYNLSLPQQNLLNTYFHDQWDVMSVIYNLPDYFGSEHLLYKKYGLNITRILHFAGKYKPWTPRPPTNHRTEAIQIWQIFTINMLIEYGWTKEDFRHCSVCQQFWLDSRFQQLLNSRLQHIRQRVLN